MAFTCTMVSPFSSKMGAVPLHHAVPPMNGVTPGTCGAETNQEPLLIAIANDCQPEQLPSLHRVRKLQRVEANQVDTSSMEGARSRGAAGFTKAP